MSLLGVVDIGGTKIAAGIVDERFRVVARRSAPTPSADGPAAVLALVAHLLREVSRDAGVRPVGIGAGTAGVVNSDTGQILVATDALPGWAGTPVASLLAAELALPVHVENDVTAFLLGEVAAGAAVGVADVIAIGTGIGGAVLVDGHVVRGRMWVAGNIGHVPSPEAGARRCLCGRRGHLEGFASGPAMTARYEELSGRSVADLHEVARRAESGDDIAEEVLRTGAAAVGRIAGGLVNVLDPSLVLLGGGVAGLGSWYVQAVQEAISKEVVAPVDLVAVRASSLRGDAMLVGAAASARAAGIGV